MKILLISPLPPPKGGIATWTIAYKNSSILKEHSIEIVNTAIMEKRRKKLKRLYLIEEIKRLINILKSLEQKIQNKKFDVAHINSSCSALGLYRDYICIKILKKRKIKIFIHFHCDVSYMVKHRSQKNLLKKILANIDGAITLNKVSYQYIKAIDENIKVTIIPNFINEDLVIKQNKKINNKIEKIIYVGRVCKEKGSNIIFDIAKEFPNIQFKMIGKVTQEFDNIEKPINIILEGEKASNYVIKELKKSDLFIFPTNTEGFPCALLEAMAVGLPIITTKVGAIQDMLEQNGGIYCRLNKREDFIEAINRLNYNKEQREKMSMWNINKVKQMYLQENVIKKIIELYEGENN